MRTANGAVTFLSLLLIKETGIYDEERKRIANFIEL